MTWERLAPDRLQVWLPGVAATERLGHALAAVLPPGSVVGFVGDLGAGKTRLIRAIAEALGVDPDTISSPTFVLIHEYDGRIPVYHFDVYRLGSAGEFDALGAAEYFEAGGLCLIEWADRIADRVPAGAWWIRITAGMASSERDALIEAPPSGLDELEQALSATSD